jgi:trigger factor
MSDLNIEIEQLADHQAKITVEFEPEVLTQYQHKAARKIAEKGKIPGFRPGKAPFDVIRRTYGEAAINEQAIEMIVDDKYSEVLEQAKINPGAPGSLEEVVSVDPPKFVFIVPKEPEVELGDYKSVRLDYNLEPVTDEDVEKVVKNLQSSYATTESVDRPAQTGDMVYIQLQGRILNPKEGEKENYLDNTSFEIVVGGSEADPDNWPYEGFSKVLDGMSKDEEKVVTHTYKKDDQNENLQGKKVEFVIKVEEVKLLKLPELDQNFAQMVGNFENMDILRTQVREQAEHQKKHEYEDNYYDELLEKVTATSVVKYPPQVLEEEQKDILKSFEDNLGRQKMDLDAYLKMREFTKEKFMEEEVKPAAVKRLTRSLVMSEIAKLEKIEVDQEELKNVVTMRLDSLLRSPAMKKVRGDKDIQNLTTAIMMDTANHLYNEKTLECLKDIATGKATEILSAETTGTAAEDTGKVQEEKNTEVVKAKAPKKSTKKATTESKSEE